MLAANGLFPISRLTEETNRDENIATIRTLSRSTYLGNHQAVCRVLGRYLMFVNTLDERLGVQLQMNGFWEMNITEFIARQVKPGMNVLDVGANYGYFSMLMADLIGPEGQIHALEANPMLSRLVIKSSKVNGFENKLKVINQGVSDQAGEDIDFVYSDDTPMNGMLAGNMSQQAREKHYPNTIKVQVNAIDDLLKDAKPIDFIKVDIEGAEDKFWYGSQQIRDKNPNMMILLEFNRARYHNVDAFIDQIFEQGYQVTQLSHKQSLYKTITAEDMKQSSTAHHMMLAIQRR
ncbi:FkbM family methyltransferase [Marinicella meishanensis]|uniref:FkbM family methyltransferase n=1 Tax=Marinicella meishanensis TaxID=2873263 RepID=UPI001CC18F47|nr:FkbM family methyltransferase [Marinicella sp. NBU2979]